MYLDVRIELNVAFVMKSRYNIDNIILYFVIYPQFYAYVINQDLYMLKHLFSTVQVVRHVIHIFFICRLIKKDTDHRIRVCIFMLYMIMSNSQKAQTLYTFNIFIVHREKYN